MTSFPIQIDATPLFYRYFIIPGVTQNWTDSRTVQTFDLQTKVYNFQIASGSYADFSFRVTSDGTVDYDAKFDAFLQGRGTNRLVLRGHSVTIDARYLGMSDGAGVLLCDVPMTNADWILHQTLRLLPGSHYRLQQGSGLVSSFTFKLAVDGTFAYDPAYDVAAHGFLAGSGSATLPLRLPRARRWDRGRGHRGRSRRCLGHRVRPQRGAVRQSAADVALPHADLERAGLRCVLRRRTRRQHHAHSRRDLQADERQLQRGAEGAPQQVAAGSSSSPSSAATSTRRS